QIFDTEGPNDAFVSVESATWGKHMETIPLSHLAQMHLQMNKDSKKIYEQFWLNMLKTLTEMGH
ncbi:MAG: hypothetical protein WD607_05205, partial [Candidatus Paceibacterota bacterium]